MNIGIDITPVLYGTGVSVYTYNLVKSLLLLDSRNRYILFGGNFRRYSELKQKTKGLNGNYLVKLFRIPPTFSSLIWNNAHIIPVEKLIGNIDIFHSSDWVQPPSKAFKVTTVHDLTPVIYPKLVHPRIASQHALRLKWVKKEVERIIVPSFATMDDLINLGFDKDKIRVIPEAVDPVLDSEIPGRESIDSKFSLQDKKYILSVGVGPRKNTKRIIQAMKYLGAMKLHLVIVGYDHYGNKAENKSVTFTGHISKSELAGLYAYAEALVYPSLYEGFGLPILEAFHMGIPVVTSNISSMPEVAGKAAILVNPYKIKDIAMGVQKAVKLRDFYVPKGKERLKEFSWQKNAKETLSVYSEAESILKA